MIAERESKNDRSCIDFRENGYSSVSGESPCFIRILILERFDNQITRKVSILSFFSLSLHYVFILKTVWLVRLGNIKISYIRV